MEEACYCGRVGEIEDREPILDGDGQSALRCPSEACGHLDDLRWLSADARRCVFENAGRARNARRSPAA
jgi:hypothetical protein